MDETSKLMARTEENSTNISQNLANVSQKVELKWKNRERVMIFCARGTTFRSRHLMNDFKSLMPHSKSENKLDKREYLSVINEIAEMANCSKCLYFENRKQKDLYLWMSNITDGPSMKFLVHNVHTMDELRMSGNCLKSSRPILSFDSKFDSKPHLLLIKHMIAQIFTTPYHHPRSQPFIDHIFSFSLFQEDKIWFRNFQVVDDSLELQEIGPRMVLEIIRIFDGSFEGNVLYNNPNYVSPNTIRRNMKKIGSDKYVKRKSDILGREEKNRKLETVQLPDPVGEIFDTNRKIRNPKAKFIKHTIEKKKSRKRKKKAV